MESSIFLKYLGFFFLAVAGQGLFFAFTQLSTRNLNAPRFFLSLIVLCFSLALVESGLWWSEQMDHMVHLVYISVGCPFLFGPLVYLYFKYSVAKQSVTKKDVLHFIPFLLYFSYCAQFYFSSTASKNAMMAGDLAFNSFFVFYIPSIYTLVLKGVSLVTYAIICWKQFYHKTTILTEVKSWFVLAFGVYAFYVLNFLVFHVLDKLNVVGGCSDYGIASAMSIFIYLFSWFGFVRPKVFDGYSVSEVLRPAPFQKYKSSVLSEDLELELGEKLLALMNNEQLYKDEALRLDTLAERLGVSRNSVSQVINRTGMNFFEYINSWRIEEAKRILAQTSKQEFNIIEVAYQVGFSNKVSFNKSFKKSTGLTPTEFRKISLEKNA